MAERGVTFTKRSAARIAAVVRAAEREPVDLTGERRSRPPLNSRREFWAKIESYAALGGGAVNRYLYAWREQRRTATGFESWSDARVGFAINSAEANNAATGIQGNSVDHDDPDYPAGFDLQPVRGNPVVWMRRDKATDDTIVYTFQYENAEQGSCS